MSAEAIIASFNVLAELLSSSPVQNEEKKQERCQCLAAMTYWLECSPQRWLLIFDKTDGCGFSEFDSVKRQLISTPN